MPRLKFQPRRLLARQGRHRVWFFDLDDTLHHASARIFPALSRAMGDYMVHELQMAPDEAHRLRQRYWARYGATLLGLIRHHGVDAGHFLHITHQLPELEDWLHGHAHDRAALRRLRGPKVLLTNAPEAYARRVLALLQMDACFDLVLGFEQQQLFGIHRPKPDARMLRHLLVRLRLLPHQGVLVEDSLLNLKAAHQVGLQTVWMQRWLRGISRVPQPQAQRWRRRPGYVTHRTQRLASLQRLF